ncbi:hypothetical protein U14_01241 [Candidatus Moduliflexus flocculans]|uniref:Uncharacterized protein n=1 Tax=Candidatus Moduliflexus flocculans TaxID=1499966 RepID=A0A0S6VRX5_9BACT|nr:hypothetical protein U14_01241 [Candidatus Moduliflexus flocculans]
MIGVIAVFVCLSVFNVPNLRAEQDVFPLSPGTYWLYEGMVKWQNESGVKEQQMTWKMEVIEQVERDEFIGYLMKGHPSDLAFYEEGRVPSEYAIIRHGNDFYQTDLNTFQRLKDPADELNDLLFPEDQILKFPLTPGDTFGEPEMLKRGDGFYYWVVQEKRPFLAKITGVVSIASLEEYIITLNTLPDGIIVHFTPGIGITCYEYTHHGTISEVDVSLIEYHAGTH